MLQKVECIIVCSVACHVIYFCLQQEVAPDSKMIEKLNSTNWLKIVINASISAACNSLTKLSQLSEVDKFYWHFIASCCSHVQPNVENLAKLNSYLFVTEKLSAIFRDYCSTRYREKHTVINEIPQEINHISNTDIKDYFSWVIKMQSVVIHLQSKYLDEEFNYDDILAYAGNLHSIHSFAKYMLIGDLTYTADEIGRIKENYSTVYTKLFLVLVKYNKGYGW